MPPRLFLNVNASVQSFRPGAAGGAVQGIGDDNAACALHAPSIEIGPSGTLKLFKSFQAFEFNPLGMTRNMAPLASGAAAMQTSYKVRCSRCMGQARPKHGLPSWHLGGQGGVERCAALNVPASPPAPRTRSLSTTCA